MQDEKKRQNTIKGREKSNRNLMPVRELNASKTPEERRESARKAGIASGKAKREKKSIRELCAELLVQDAPDEFIAQAFPEGAPEDKSWYALIVAQQARQAAAGNTKAAVFIRDSAGDMPTTKLQTDIGMTEADRELLRKIERRMSGNTSNSIDQDGKIV